MNISGKWTQTFLTAHTVIQKHHNFFKAHKNIQLPSAYNECSFLFQFGLFQTFPNKLSKPISSNFEW